MDGFAGGCRCGAVRYHLATPHLPRSYACHCRDCQTWSGSAFSQQVVAAQDALSVTGNPVLFELTAPSGRVSRQFACGTCHTRLYNTNSARPGKVVVRAGTLDVSDALDVVAHIWVARKQRWIAIPPGVPVWPEAATPAELAAVLQ